MSKFSNNNIDSNVFNQIFGKDLSKNIRKTNVKCIVCKKGYMVMTDVEGVLECEKCHSKHFDWAK